MWPKDTHDEDDLCHAMHLSCRHCGIYFLKLKHWAKGSPLVVVTLAECYFTVCDKVIS